ncbi:MAG TPA: peptide deformylase [bacterium]|nr:peptide deformylase [bacterium]HOL67824.1 peptide deformylase [bacterium]HPP12179.1 peptide deformylase [bacterium]
MKRIRTFGDEVLRTRCTSVTVIDERVRRWLRYLRETLLASKGVGLAAPQIGIRRRIFLARNPETEKVLTFINPEIVECCGQRIDLEGCLSFPEIFFSIQRAEKVTLTALDEHGRRLTTEATGLLARCFQHECDHLNGILIIDYASAEEKSFWKERLEKLRDRHRS